MRTSARLALAVLIVLLSTAAFADDLTGSERFLCSAETLTACTEDGACFNENPAAFDVPDFVEVDLQKKRISTTKASGMDRSSDVATFLRNGGRIVLQGVQGDRAYSLIIVEDTGILTASIAFDGFSLGIFGACTPLNDSK